jgi:argininosuccinate lyase
VSDAPEDRKGKGGLWGGRFSGGMAPEMVPLNRSLDVDFRLWREDLQGSRAWARALGNAGVLTPDESGELIRGLDRVEERLDEAFPSDAVSHAFPFSDEDIHSLVERLLGEEVGELAGKLHTGRSRNDQAATDFRLWGMKAAEELADRTGELALALAHLAEAGMDLILPGYTHLQPGQPVRAAHWALSHAWPLVRDVARLEGVARSAGVLPLGSGALAGCPFPVDRSALAEELGFHAVSENSMDGVSDRDWAAELLFAGALLGVHLSRLGEDLVLFSSREFSFLRLDDGYSTGSSLMPQKRNPDAAELIRGKSGRLVGNVTGLLTLLKGLPTGYNRDLQEDKHLVFDSVDTLRLVVPAMAGAVATSRFLPEGMARALAPELLATDLADVLVRAGVPFRKSHEILGRLVREAEERGVALSELPEEVFRGHHPALAEAAGVLADYEGSVEARAVPGGTARAEVEEQLRHLRERLGG